MNDETNEMNKLLPVYEILKFIEFSEKNNTNHHLKQYIEKNDDGNYNYRFSILSDTENHHFNAIFDEKHLKIQIDDINKSQKDKIIQKVETITTRFNLSELEKKKCST